MADVELIIKISEDIYQEAIKSGYSHLYDEEVANAVEIGIPIPKGHGKIVDANRVLENGDNWEVETALMQTEAIIEADNSESEGMVGNIFENLTEEERTLAWMYMIFNKDKIKAKTEQWTKEAEEAGMTLTEYLEFISPLNDKKKLSWLGKNCKDCGNEKCKKLGTLPKGYNCALWQSKSEGNKNEN